MNGELRKKLKSGEKKIAVWGVGYIGYSSMAYFAKEGVNCIGYDVHKERVDNVNTEGSCVIKNIEFWLAFDVAPLVKSKRIFATHNWKDLISDDVAVHLIGIPTEKNGAPFNDHLKDVLTKLFTEYKQHKTSEPPLIVIESTITPNLIEDMVFPLAKELDVSIGKDVLLGVAPRRDWFVSPDKTLKTLPRVVGGTDKYTTQLIGEVCGIISNTVLEATDHRHACIVKSVENAFRQLDITFANQLSLAYPHLNTVEILKLAGTKWNVGTYHPSFGTGGYCIPLAPQYVLQGAKHPEKLTLLKESLTTDFSQPQRVAKSLIDRGFKKIGILGLAYVGDLKVSVLCPTLALSRELLALGAEVKVQDPLFSAAEIKAETNCDTFEFPTGMNEFDAIVIVSTHMQYKSTPHIEIIENLENCTFVLDNMGIWRDLELPEKIEYHEAGDAGWLESEE